MSKKISTLIFLGAGATADLGFPTTYHQEKFFKALIEDSFLKGKNLSIEERLKRSGIEDKEIIEDFKQTLLLLMDGDGKQSEIDAIKSKEKAEKKFFTDIEKIFKIPNIKYKLKHYLNIYFYPYYDWLAFKSIYVELLNCSDNVKLHHVLSVIIKALADNVSLPTKELFCKEKKYTLPTYLNYKQRLEGAIRAYKLLIFKLFKHSFRKLGKKNIKLYEKFFKESLKEICDFEIIPKESKILKENFISHLSYATLNWDPITPFYLFKLAKVINESLNKGKIYISHGVPFIIYKLSGKENIGYTMEENSAFFMNLFALEKRFKDIFIKIVKLFVPHGLINLRVCPRCQSVFLIFPCDVGELSLERLEDLFLLDPLPTSSDLKIIKNRKYKNYPLNENWLPSKIKCPECGIDTFFFDTFMTIQSIFKIDKSPLMEKVYFDYANTASKAKHLIFIGYSFPDDDITHLLNLLTMNTGLCEERKVTLILKDDRYKRKIWYSLNEIKDKVGDGIRKTLLNASLIAKENNIRVSFLGFPQILEKINVKDILHW